MWVRMVKKFSIDTDESYVLSNLHILLNLYMHGKWSVTLKDYDDDCTCTLLAVQHVTQHPLALGS